MGHGHPLSTHHTRGTQDSVAAPKRVWSVHRGARTPKKTQQAVMGLVLGHMPPRPVDEKAGRRGEGKPTAAPRPEPFSWQENVRRALKKKATHPQPPLHLSVHAGCPWHFFLAGAALLGAVHTIRLVKGLVGTARQEKKRIENFAATFLGYTRAPRQKRVRLLLPCFVLSSLVVSAAGGSPCFSRSSSPWCVCLGAIRICGPPPLAPAILDL